MNQVVTGTIDSIYTKEVNTKRGPAQVYHAMVNGQDINLGFKTSHSQGEAISWNVEEKYGSLQYIEEAPANSSNPVAGSIPIPNVQAPIPTRSATVAISKAPTQFPTIKGTKDVSIIRQNSLTHASRVVHDMHEASVISIKNEEEYVNKVLEIAYIFADFSTGWREVKEAEAQMAFNDTEAEAQSY